jgi:hypothetical protein
MNWDPDIAFNGVMHGYMTAPILKTSPWSQGFATTKGAVLPLALQFRQGAPTEISGVNVFNTLNFCITGNDYAYVQTEPAYLSQSVIIVSLSL